MSIAETGRNFLKNAAKYVAAPLLLITVACNQTETTPINMVNAQPSPAPLSGTAESPTPKAIRTPTRRLVTPTKVPEIITVIPTTLAHETATKVPERVVFGIGISEKLLRRLTRPEIDFLEERIRTHLTMFPCNNLPGLKIYEAGEHRPGNELTSAIYVDWNYIQKGTDESTKRGMQLTPGQIMASDVLTKISMKCSDTSKTEKTVVIFENGVRAEVGAGLEVAIFDKDGVKQNVTVNPISDGVATGLAIFSFGVNRSSDSYSPTPIPGTDSKVEMFSTGHPSSYYTGALTFALIPTNNSALAAAQELNDYKNNGDFKGLTAFVMGIPKKEVTETDMAKVVIWYFQAAQIKSQEELITFIQRIDNERQQRQKEKTNQNIQPDTIEGLTHRLAKIKQLRRTGRLNQKQAVLERRKIRDQIWILRRAEQLRREKQAREQAASWSRMTMNKNGAIV